MTTRKTLISLTATLWILSGCGGGGGGGTSAPTTPVNAVPVAASQSVATDPGTNYSGSLSGTDGNGDALTFAVVMQPTSGTVTLSGTGNRDFMYAPNGGFAGTDTFTFTASDASSTSPAATVTVNVNNKPVAIGASATTSDIASVVITATSTDVEADAITYSLATPPTKGTISNVDAASGEFTYTPNPTQDGVDTFEVVAADAFQTSDPVQVDVEILRWGDTQQFGTPSADGATTNGLRELADGRFVFGGRTEGQIASTMPAGASDAWVRVTDRRGNEEWTVQFGDAATNNARVILPAPDNSGIFVLTQQNVLDPATNTVLASGGLIYKFDNDGNLLFSATLDFQAAQIAVGVYQGDIDSNGDLYVVSWTRNTRGSTLTKVDGTNGDTIWQQELAGTASSSSLPNPAVAFDDDWSRLRFRSVDIDGAGNLVLAGNYSPNSARACSDCSFFARFDSDGNLIDVTELDEFAFQCFASDNSRLQRITVAPDQSLWAVGAGSTAPPQNSFGQVTRFDETGTQISWSHCESTSSEGAFYFSPIKFTTNSDGLVSGDHVEFDAGGFIESGVTRVSRIDTAGNVTFTTELSATRLDSSPAIFGSGSLLEDEQGILYVTASTDGEFVSGAALGEGDVIFLRMDAAGNVQ